MAFPRDNPEDNQEEAPDSQTSINEFITKRLDDQEAMLGSLTIAYVELFSGLELVIKTIVQGFPTKEEQEGFIKNFEKLRSDVFKSIQQVSRSGTEGLDPESKRAVENMAERRKTH